MDPTLLSQRISSWICRGGETTPCNPPMRASQSKWTLQMGGAGITVDPKSCLGNGCELFSMPKSKQHLCDVGDWIAAGTRVLSRHNTPGNCSSTAVPGHRNEGDWGRPWWEWKFSKKSIFFLCTSKHTHTEKRVTLTLPVLPAGVSRERVKQWGMPGAENPTNALIQTDKSAARLRCEAEALQMQHTDKPKQGLVESLGGTGTAAPRARSSTCSALLWPKCPQQQLRTRGQLHLVTNAPLVTLWGPCSPGETN